MKADRLEYYRNQLRGVPVEDLGRKMWEVLLAATDEAAKEEREACAMSKSISDDGPSKEDVIGWMHESGAAPKDLLPPGFAGKVAVFCKVSALAWAAAARDEREACAKVAASHSSEPWKHDAGAAHVCDMVSVSISAAIRSRGGK